MTLAGLCAVLHVVGVSWGWSRQNDQIFPRRTWASASQRRETVFVASDMKLVSFSFRIHRFRLAVLWYSCVLDFWRLTCFRVLYTESVYVGIVLYRYSWKWERDFVKQMAVNRCPCISSPRCFLVSAVNGDNQRLAVLCSVVCSVVWLIELHRVVYCLV